MMKKFIKVISLLMATCLSFCACAPAAGNNETEPKETVKIMQKEDPAADDTINLLMIGNSFCYYYTDELHAMAKEAGVKLRVCNVYYSGCTLTQHWKWWKSGEANYEYITTDDKGRKVEKGVNLEYCLQQQNWDYISLQSPSYDMRSKPAAEVLTLTKTERTELWNYIQQQFPQSKHMWQQTWAYEVGYDKENYKMTSKAQQEEYAQRQREYALTVCEEFNLIRVKSGEAWKIMRDNGYDKLCARMAVNGGEGDYYHDGDIGGGQYLNACVWFETITGQSCIGNTFRPKVYTLSEDMINTLQQAVTTK